MATSKLERTEWQKYFDHVSKTHNGRLAEIEINSLDIGSQLQTKWIPLLGITYDKKSELIEVIVEGLDHMIRKPQEVYVEEDGSNLSSLEIIDSDDVKQIIRFREPRLLPHPLSV